ncbi:hypothetical protein CXG81DRAFT_26953 [Caulochytrium protostelioides]|uniref:Ribosome biogenesis protein NSA1 n=1 Tax=Caulochytrium protostelioides TaxID=1555241 RepID=A0A4P9X5D7_9FUNG|nr:hypothetical protein CXG81DRAFT_26953 [Caulochytrium protostelioides]|eukprot:RKP00333.1 hypothetical protein CXG81DRAFT_26953 [Caulochytrium protostelioides]
MPPPSLAAATAPAAAAAPPAPPSLTVLVADEAGQLKRVSFNKPLDEHIAETQAPRPTKRQRLDAEAAKQKALELGSGGDGVDGAQWAEGGAAATPTVLPHSIEVLRPMNKDRAVLQLAELPFVPDPAHLAEAYTQAVADAAAGHDVMTTAGLTLDEIDHRTVGGFVVASKDGTIECWRNGEAACTMATWIPLAADEEWIGLACIPNRDTTPPSASSPSPSSTPALSTTTTTTTATTATASTPPASAKDESSGDGQPIIVAVTSAGRVILWAYTRPIPAADPAAADAATTTDGAANDAAVAAPWGLKGYTPPNCAVLQLPPRADIRAIALSPHDAHVMAYGGKNVDVAVCVLPVVPATIPPAAPKLSKKQRRAAATASTSTSTSPLAATASTRPSFRLRQRWAAQRLVNTRLDENTERIAVTDIAFLPHSPTMLVVGTLYGELRIYDTAAGTRPQQRMLVRPQEPLPVTSLSALASFHRTFSIMLVSDTKGYCYAIRSDTLRVMGNMPGPAGAVRQIGITPNGRYGLGVGLDRHLYVWTVRARRKFTKLYLKQRLTRVLALEGLAAMQMWRPAAATAAGSDDAGSDADSDAGLEAVAEQDAASDAEDEDWQHLERDAAA